MTQTIYIAGPIGTAKADIDAARTKFADAQRALEGHGWHVINPFANGVPLDATRRTHIRASTRMLCDADAIYFLRGWVDSPGSFMEYLVALNMEIPVYAELYCLPVPHDEGHITEPYHAYVYSAPFNVDTSDDSESVAQEAHRISSPDGDRNKDYGHPLDNFNGIAALWNAHFGTSFSYDDVAHAMILMKLNRDTHQPKRDNLVDIAGYANAAQMAREEDDARD